MMTLWWIIDAYLAEQNNHWGYKPGWGELNEFGHWIVVGLQKVIDVIVLDALEELYEVEFLGNNECKLRTTHERASD